MRKIILLLLMLTACSQVFSQQPKFVPCSQNPVYRQFDFWLGEWEAFDTTNVKRGDSRIERLLDSCVILENWTSNSKFISYSGKSYNTFNSTTGKWQQYWVDNKGGVTEYFDGHYENNKMTLQTANLKQPDGTSLIMRMVFTKLNDDMVRQHGQSSTDGGQTWKTTFDLQYRRKK